MEIKKDILWRVYLSYLLIVCLGVFIFGKAFYIQQVQGKYWRSMSDSLHQKIEEVEADRGTIYSEDGQMLSTSIPQFNIYIDFAAEGLREKNGKRFKENVDSLSYYLANLFKDRSPEEYKRLLKRGYNTKSRYFLLKEKISFSEYKTMRSFPLVRQGRNKSGFIAETKNIRLNPYKILAYRTIGLDRENSQKVGLEQTYDSVLKGVSGRRLVRYIAGGVGVPVEDYATEPENGKDIITTLDVFIQEVTENALMKMMEKNEAQHGCAIVMEVKTGKVKAIANLGRRPDGTYWEDYNYAVTPSEPGSTFKLATMLAVLEDKKVNLKNTVNLGGGTWQIGGRTVFDSEQHGRYDVTIQQAFELSSNVGMAKLVQTYYSGNPSAYINRLKKLKLDTLTGIDLYGERSPVIYKPGSKYWSGTTLPWMSFGYNILVSPLQTLMLYNAVANNGKLMKPYLVAAIKENGLTVKDVHPQMLEDQICSAQTLAQLKQCLEGVCSTPGATAYNLFKNSPYRVAGKTGTALVANNNKGYADKIYQSSFAGYFPADDPQYACIVVIKNKPHASVFYGASVAGPVFKEIADRLYTTYIKHNKNHLYQSTSSNTFTTYVSHSIDARAIIPIVNGNNQSTNTTEEWVSVINAKNKVDAAPKKINTHQMPNLKSMALKDALFLCESLGLQVSIAGKGKIIRQSIAEGERIVKGNKIVLELN